MGGWKHGDKKPTHRAYNTVMGYLFVAVPIGLAVQWLISRLR